MDFIEQLKSVGGVKPCPVSHRDDTVVDTTGLTQLGKTVPLLCSICHGTGQVIDLAPLLAKPKELQEVVHELLFQQYRVSRCSEPRCGNCIAWSEHNEKPDFVVGHQRANNLVYEVARQLGGTAVVAVDRWDPTQKGGLLYQNLGYRLSLSIPDTVTVLFVTDKMDADEMYEIAESLCGENVPRTYLPYILALVSNLDTFNMAMPGSPWKVVSLHQEKA